MTKVIQVRLLNIDFDFWDYHPDVPKETFNSLPL